MEISAFELLPPETLLERAMAACEDVDQFKFMHGTFPALRDSSLNLAKYVCDVVPSKDDAKPLLYLCVEEAWNSYRRADRAGASMNERAAAYMRGLITHLGQVNEYRVYVKVASQCVAWRMGVESLYEFLCRYPHHAPRVVKEQYAFVDEVSARQAVAARIIDLYYVGGFGGSFEDLTADAGAAAPALVAVAPATAP